MGSRIYLCTRKLTRYWKLKILPSGFSRHAKLCFFFQSLFIRYTSSAVRCFDFCSYRKMQIAFILSCPFLLCSRRILNVTTINSIVLYVLLINLIHHWYIVWLKTAWKSMKFIFIIIFFYKIFDMFSSPEHKARRTLFKVTLLNKPVIQLCEPTFKYFFFTEIKLATLICKPNISITCIREGKALKIRISCFTTPAQYMWKLLPDTDRWTDTLPRPRPKC